MYDGTVSIGTPTAVLDAVDSQFLAEVGCEPCSLLADPRARKAVRNLSGSDRLSRQCSVRAEALERHLTRLLRTRPAETAVSVFVSSFMDTPTRDSRPDVAQVHSNGHSSAYCALPRSRRLPCEQALVGFHSRAASNPYTGN